MHRLSIDIDIPIIKSNKDDVDMNDILSKVVEGSNVFHRYEENVRSRKNKILKSHYKIFYNSNLDETESYILLDILFEKSHYISTIQKDINCKFIDYHEPTRSVKMPSTDCMLGDKLTAFAPNTTGIPYGNDKELEIIKQLFDVANLFDVMENIEVVSETFKLMAQQELAYRGRGGAYTYKDVA